MGPQQTGAPIRTRGVQARPHSMTHLLIRGAERAGRRRSAMHYLLTVDITSARRLMAMSPETLSLTGFVVASVARAAAEHPAVHSYKDWRGRLISHRHVDVMIPLGVRNRRGPGSIDVPYVVSDADVRDVTEVSAELLAAKNAPVSGIFSRLAVLAGLPGLAWALCSVLDRSVRLRQRIGTVSVTTTGMHEIGDTFGIAAPTLMPLQVSIGSISPCSHTTGHLIERHENLNLTLTFDRGIVDGAEAAEFATRLCLAIERAEVLLQLDSEGEPTTQAAVSLVEPQAAAPGAPITW